MSRKPPKTPQEKKALSLARDRSGYFFGNNKAARKAVPLRKALESRRIRHKNNQAVSQIEYVDDAAVDLIESSARHDVARKGGWRKGASEPLGECIKRGLEARRERVGRKSRSRQFITND
ncbi:hypothetical protein [Novosphingobium album (ex Hu et al. 2023)]|uniref:Uncharacterized protein n=1 Tax=Novosphingobium album (ex Hu et al. 2023) TaxID=2930093 RepID=A0ABT0B222_9SPHN|nr:hypothetical protein [Novosphingobium album (ex Hu et al. 2023)]MCJ2179126.1 hypothetical protein [Novosphingobium album (ex Hu et al. 2023)]